MQNRRADEKRHHGLPRDDEWSHKTRIFQTARKTIARQYPHYQEGGRAAQYGPGGHWVPEGPLGGPYGHPVAPMQGQPPMQGLPPMQGQPWGYMARPGAGPPYAYPPAQAAWPPAEAAPSPVFPPGAVWQQQQQPAAAHPWQQPPLDMPGQVLPWQQDAQMQQQAQMQMQQVAQMQQGEAPPLPPPSDAPLAAPPLPAEAPPAPPDGPVAEPGTSGVNPPAEDVGMEVAEEKHAVANGDHKDPAGPQAIQDQKPSQPPLQPVPEQAAASGQGEAPPGPSRNAAAPPVLTAVISAGPSPAGNSRHSSPMGQARPAFLKSNPPIMMTLKRRDGLSSLSNLSSTRSPAPVPQPQKAATPPPEPSTTDNAAPAPRQNGGAPPEDERKPERRRRMWDDSTEPPSQDKPSQGASRQGTPQVPSGSQPQPTPSKRRSRDKKKRSVSTSSSSSEDSSSRSPSSSRTSSAEATSTSGRDGSESPRVGRRSTDYRRSRARDTRSPVSLSPARRRDRMRSRQRSRSPYRHSKHRRWHRRSRTRSRSRERSRYQSVRTSPDRRYTPHYHPSRRRSPTRQPSRSPIPSKPARATQPSRRRSRTPPQRYREASPAPAELQEVEDDEVPPPPPDEPMPGELDLQLEMEAITAMDQLIQARITEIAAQYGCDFDKLDAYGCRDLCEDLYTHVYPEHPDFSAWDVSDATELAALQQEEASLTMGMEFARQGLPDISDISLGPPPLELENRHLSEVLEKQVLLSPDEHAVGDPRNRPEAGELEPELPPVLLPVPLFALGPLEAAVAPGGGWEEESVLSWSESPRLTGLTEEVEFRPAVAPEEAQAELMQAPAAPRHETMVRDDDRDWTKEQMARAQEQAAPSLPRGPPKDPEKGEDWSWMEVHRERGFGFTSRPYSFMDLRGWAQERQYGLDFGVPIYRKNDGLWLPLTEVPVDVEDLEWAGDGHTPAHAAGAEEAGPGLGATTARQVTVPEMEAAGMSDEDASQWLEHASTAPRLPPAENGNAAGKTLQVQADVMENGDASPSGDDSLDVFAWFDEESSLKRQAASLARARAKEEAARKKMKVPSLDVAVASTAGGRRLWGAPPPPQHSAMLRGKLASAVLSGAAGKTIVAEMIGRAAIKVLETRGPEIEARRAALRAKGAERAPKPRTPEQRGRGSGKAAKSHHGKEEAPASARKKKRDADQSKAPAIRELDERPAHQHSSREERAQGSKRAATPPSKAADRTAAAVQRAATPVKERTPGRAEEAKPVFAEPIKQEAEPARDSAVKSERPEADGGAPARDVQQSAKLKAEPQSGGSAEVEDARPKDSAAAPEKEHRENLRKAQLKQQHRRMKHILADDGSEDTDAPSDVAASGDAGVGARPLQKRHRLQKHASLDALQASAAISEGGISVAVADAAPQQAKKLAQAAHGQAEEPEEEEEEEQSGRAVKGAGSRRGRAQEPPRPKDKGKAGAKAGRGRARTRCGKRRASSREDSDWEEQHVEPTEKRRRKESDVEEAQDGGTDDDERVKEEQLQSLRQMKAWEQHRDKQCYDALDAILRALVKKDRQFECPFLDPVDTRALTTYLDIIKQPICIQDIMGKVKRKEYPPRKEGLDAFLADVKLMCDNCRLFNEDNPPYIEFADEIEEHIRKVADVEWRKTTDLIGARRRI